MRSIQTCLPPVSEAQLLTVFTVGFFLLSLQDITCVWALELLIYCTFHMHMTNSKIPPPPSVKIPFLFSLFLLQACHDREWISAAAAAAPLPTCDVRSACCASRSAAWWRQTLSTWWCSVWWLSTPSVWPLSTTINPTGSPSSSVGFFCECLCCLLFFFFLDQKSEIRSENTFFLAAPCFILLSDFCFSPLFNLQTMQSLFSWGCFWLRCFWKCMVWVSGCTSTHLSTASTVGWGPSSPFLTLC